MKIVAHAGLATLDISRSEMDQYKLDFDTEALKTRILEKVEKYHV